MGHALPEGRCRSSFAALPVIPGGWPCVLADPPWRFRDRGSRIAPDQRRKRLGRKGYRTLTSEQIADLPVRDVVARDALLFLWSTSAHLLDGSSPTVARAWGFEPKATIVWVKRRPPRLNPRTILSRVGAYLEAESKQETEPLLRGWLQALRREVDAYLRDTLTASGQEADVGGRVQVGMGHYVRGAHELLLVCRRGGARVRRRDVPSVFFAPRGAHSAKPARAFDLFERLAEGPRLELFARGERPGWTAWGDQA